MNTTPLPPPLSTTDRVLLALHGLAAAVFGIVGFVQATDPGWADLQRLVVVMIVAAWAAGIAVMALLARRIHRRSVRAALLLAGPFLGVLLLFTQFR